MMVHRIGRVMSCIIHVEKVVGLNPDPSMYVPAAEIIGTANGCNKVLVEAFNTSVEAEVNPDGSFIAPFVHLHHKCGYPVKVKVVCIEGGPCKAFEEEIPLLCNGQKHVRPLYVTYFDCRSWTCNVEIMNVQATNAKCIITAYGRPGLILWQDTLELNPHATMRIKLNEHVKGEGHVTVEPAEPGHEFPSVMGFNTRRTWFSMGTQFVPFTRVP